MDFYSEEQKELARNADIITFLNRLEGFTFVRSGKGWRCVEHDSLYVNEDRRGWHWNSQGQSGNNAISYCEKIHSMKFPAAMLCIIGAGSDIILRPPPVKKAVQAKPAMPFVLPEKADGKFSRAFAYLNKTRGIDKNIIAELMRSKKIYQDKRGNVVFVGYDKANVPVFASLRGTLTDKQFRGDCEGSDKRFSFSLKGENPELVYVFESPIDLLSHATMANIIIKNPAAWKWNNRISASGVSDVALRQFLDDNPECRKIIFCLNNDPAGRRATAEFMEKYTQCGYICENKPPRTKDYNDELTSYLSAVLEKQEEKQPKPTITPPMR